MHRNTTIGALGFLVLVAACSSSGGTSKGPTSDGGPVTLQGKVLDGASGAPLASTLVFVEVGGIYVPNSDTSKGNPSYKLATTTSSDGSFQITVPSGEVGLHTYQNGYRYGSLLVSDDTTGGNVVVKVESQLPADAKPVVSSFAVSSMTVSPGGMLTFTANVAAPSAGDPISEEVLLMEPSTNFAREMDPPSAGVQGKGFPNGVYKTTVSAPSTPGTYQYALVVSTEACITSDRQTVSVVVQ